MRLTPLRIAVATILTCGAELNAQGGERCPLIVIDGVVQELAAPGPGAAFGVTAYQCSSCAIKQDKELRPEYSFSAEPVVLQVAAWSVFRVGDVIEAVNGNPITTTAGANQFTFPQPGESVFKVRRDGSRTEIKATTRGQCEGNIQIDPSRIARVNVLKGNAAISQYGQRAMPGAILIETNKAPTIRPETASPTPTSESATAGRYGFAISCLPSCTRVRASDGTEYWKFEGYPPIAGIRPGGPAAMAGLGVGDMVTEVDGISILTEQGALRFQRAESKESLNLTILRRGERIGVLLKPR